jgi:2-dehydro-3-deoxyphosphooctonate aldolase (KDO 8-P synthase)
LIAGPCVIETQELTLRTAQTLKGIAGRLGIPFIFKSSFDKANRKSGKAYRGPGMDKGLRILELVKKEVGVPVITDVHEDTPVAEVASVVDVLQTPAFLVRQTSFIERVAKAGKPVHVKRGQFMAPWDLADVVAKFREAGNEDVMLCERGIRTFETATRNTFDISAIPVVKKLSHLPIIADPSHGAGRRDMVAQLARAAVAAGADGLIIEVHHDPDHALSDGAQSMFPAQFDRLMAELRIIAPAIGRSICLEPVSKRGWAR